MSAETDFHHSLTRATGLTVDAACAARTARLAQLPKRHRQLLESAIGDLERAQQTLFQARHYPWPQPQQLTLT